MHQERTPRERGTTTMATGITARHARGCSHREGRCTCRPRYQAQVWSNRDRKVIRKTFPTVSAAKAWRQCGKYGQVGTIVISPSTVQGTARVYATWWYHG